MLKSVDSAVILYERKFQEMNSQIEKEKQAQKAYIKKNDLLELKNK